VFVYAGGCVCLRVGGGGGQTLNYILLLIVTCFYILLYIAYTFTNSRECT